jgi:fumarylacetoacetate (FAA) hydrolase
MFTPLEDDLRRGWPGHIEGDRVIQLAAQTLQAFFTGGGKAREHAEYPLDGVRLLAPVPRPPSIRDFYVFEEHVRRARELRGAGPPPPEWYELPVFYFSNPVAVYGPEDTFPFPAGVEELDYELELAAVIGADGEIGGFTIMNDWSARDLQRDETTVRLGPAKGKDFATTFGPWLVTPDEIADVAAGRGYDLAMVARVNGSETSRGRWSDAVHGLTDLAARASADVHLRPGDLLGSGTVGGGCLLEVREATLGRYLEPGDVVELEVERLGVLRTPIVGRNVEAGSPQ